MIIDYLKARFIPKDKQLTKDECMVVLRGASYRQSGPYSFSYSSYESYYSIDIYDDRVKVRMNNGSFSDNDSIPFPLNKKQLLRFVRKSIY